MTVRGLARASILVILLAASSLAANASGGGDAAVDLLRYDPGGCGEEHPDGEILLVLVVDGERVLKEHGSVGEAEDTDHAFERIARPDAGAPVELAVYAAPEPENPFSRRDWRLCDQVDGPERNASTTWPEATRTVELAGDVEDAASARLVLGQAPAAPEDTRIERDPTSVTVQWDLPEDARIRVGAESLGHLIHVEPTAFDASAVRLTGICPGDEVNLYGTLESGPWTIPFSGPSVETDPGTMQAPHLFKAKVWEGDLKVWFEPTSVRTEQYELHAGDGPEFEPTRETLQFRASHPWSNSATLRASFDGEATHARVVGVDGDVTAASNAFEIGAPAEPEEDPPEPACLDARPALEPASPVPIGDEADDAGTGTDPGTEAGEPTGSGSDGGQDQASAPRTDSPTPGLWAVVLAGAAAVLAVRRR